MEKIQIIGISITGCGAVLNYNGVKYISRLLKGKENIPVFIGPNKPTIYSNQFSPAIRIQSNNAYGIKELLHPSSSIQKMKKKKTL